MCTVLSVYFYIVVYTSTLLVFTLLWKSSPFPSEIRSLSLSPGLQRLARGFCHLSTTKHVSWILLWRLEKAARFVCIAAFRTDRRTDVQADRWMDLLGVEKGNSHLSISLYIFVCTVSTAESLSEAAQAVWVQQEFTAKPTVSRRVAAQPRDWLNKLLITFTCGDTPRCSMYTKGPTNIRKTPLLFWCFAYCASQYNLRNWPI